jgi:hypothetical protein
VFEGFPSFRQFRARMQLLLAVPLAMFDGEAALDALRQVVRDLSAAGYPVAAIREITLAGVERMAWSACGSDPQRDRLLRWVELRVDEECERLAEREMPELALGV